MVGINATRIRLITFDAYNTLFKPRGSLSAQYAHEAAKVGLQVHPDSVSKGFGQAYRQQLLRAPLYGSQQGMTSEQWWEELVYNTFTEAGVEKKALDTQFPRLFHALFHRFMSREGYSVFHDVQPALRELKRRGFKMGVISNCDERLGTVLQNLQLDSFFEFVLPSCTAGVEKPDGRIFDTALDLIDDRSILCTEALHVGDDIKRDYYGARDAGWNAVLLNRIKLSYEDSNPPEAGHGVTTREHPKQIMSLKDLYPIACLLQPRSTLAGHRRVHPHTSSAPEQTAASSH
ncbi:HAD-superfamily hydrolase [Hesseltinella vesiculosa]|uniref:HAD-superfamily hydrolase n=1 Tax=Hesseltinella vesiculosa TaxID=101127 RepID=A0A1X2GI24_9FUNG|nr:HAD-superfamily hydrolase [Hesseltinella vesiculosa]